MIIVLSGGNSYLKLKKLKEIKAQFARQYGQENIENVSGETLEKAELPNLFQGASLFSAHRMVVIKGLSENKETAESLLDYLDKASDETKVVLVENQLDKRTVFYKTLKRETEFLEFDQPKEFELTKWASEYAKEQGGELGASEARLLVEAIGVNQERLSHEIEKLVAYDSKVTKETIGELVEAQPQNTVFELLDAVLSGNKKRAQELLKNLEQAFEDPFQIANLLIWQVQVLAVVKSAGDRSDSEIAKETKFSPFVISKTRRLAHNIDQAKLRDIIQKCAELDLEIKLSRAQPWRVLEHTVISL